MLQENFWDADARASATRFSIIDAKTSTVSSFALSNEAYTEHEIEDALVSVGFNNIERFPSLIGFTVDEAQELPAYVARS